MNRKNVLQYVLSLIIFFLLGIALASCLRMLDMKDIEPLSGGQTLNYADFGFSMRVPESAIVRDHTMDNLDAGGDALYAGSITTQEDGVLYLFCYENTAQDSLENHREQDVVSHYMSAGANDVRIRDFGGRPFVCYRANVLGTDGEQLWDTYETWNERIQISFETRMASDDVLPILATLDFSASTDSEIH